MERCKQGKLSLESRGFRSPWHWGPKLSLIEEQYILWNTEPSLKPFYFILFYFIDLFIYFETWSLPEHGAHQLARMVGQGVPELFLSLLPQQWGDKCVLLHPDFIYGCSYPHAHLGCTLPISLSPQVPWFLNVHTFDMFQRIQPFTIYLQLVAINALSF